jgi:hypothetical protein
MRWRVCGPEDACTYPPPRVCHEFRPGRSAKPTVDWTVRHPGQYCHCPRPGKDRSSLEPSTPCRPPVRGNLRSAAGRCGRTSISRPIPGQPARLAFQTITRDVDIHMMDLEARLVNDTIESKPFSNSTRPEGPARFSPDGSRIAFASYRSGGPEIWVAGRDGSGLQQITSRQADARTRRRWTSGTGARARSTASVVGHGHRDRVRHPRTGLRCD